RPARLGREPAGASGGTAQVLSPGPPRLGVAVRPPIASPGTPDPGGPHRCSRGGLVLPGRVAPGDGGCRPGGAGAGVGRPHRGGTPRRAWARVVDGGRGLLPRWNPDRLHRREGNGTDSRLPDRGAAPRRRGVVQPRRVAGGHEETR